MSAKERAIAAAKNDRLSPVHIRDMALEAAARATPIHKRLDCCEGIYAHRWTCVNHRHTFDGPRDCAVCRETKR